MNGTYSDCHSVPTHCPKPMIASVGKKVLLEKEKHISNAGLSISCVLDIAVGKGYSGKDQISSHTDKYGAVLAVDWHLICRTLRLQFFLGLSYSRMSKICLCMSNFLLSDSVEHFLTVENGAHLFAMIVLCPCVNSASPH